MTYTTITADDLFADLTETCERVGNLTKEEADLVELGAVAVLGIFGQGVADLEASAIAEAAEAGVSEADAKQAFGIVFNALADIVEPRIADLRDAVFAAQGYKKPTPAELAEELLTGLFGAIFGEDMAAALIAEARAEVPTAEIDRSVDEEFDRFMRGIAVNA